jgi:transposase
MLLSEEEWMDLRAYRSLKAAGATWADIAREAGCDWRTARKYLSEGAPPTPPRVTGRPKPARLIDPWAPTIDAWLTAEPRLRASVIHERLVPLGFPGTYQRVKLYVGEARERICPAPVELHRRFEVLPGAQAQVDWGDEGVIETEAGRVHVYSFHMTLSWSRDPFSCFVTSQDLTSFWDCHRRAFAHFGGVPGSILYDRTKTVVKRHVGRGEAVPLHPEAVAFAAHYGFSILVAAPRRPQSKGRVERQVAIVREHVLVGRSFTTVTDMDAAFMEWVPLRRAQVHRTHGEVIGVRAALEHGALQPLPEQPYIVCERHLRAVGKDCLVSFESSLYSVPWRRVRRRMRVELRVTPGTVSIFTVGATPEALCRHVRAIEPGTWMVDPEHWKGLPGSHDLSMGALGAPEIPVEDLMAARSKKAHVAVARRDLATYDRVGRSA